MLSKLIQFVKYGGAPEGKLRPNTTGEKAAFSIVALLIIYTMACFPLLLLAPHFDQNRDLKIVLVLLAIIEGWLLWILYRTIRALVRGGGVIYWGGTMDDRIFAIVFASAAFLWSFFGTTWQDHVMCAGLLFYAGRIWPKPTEEDIYGIGQ